MNEATLLALLGGMAGVAAMLIATQVRMSRDYQAEVKRLSEQNQDLFNRLMARNFNDYAAGTVAISPPVTRANIENYMNQYKKETEEPEPEDVYPGMSVL